MLDLERFRLLKAMEDKNTPKKKEDKNFPRLRKKKILSKKHQRKRNFGYGWREKGPKKKKNVHESHLCKGGLNK